MPPVRKKYSMGSIIPFAAAAYNKNTKKKKHDERGEKACKYMGTSTNQINNSTFQPINQRTNQSTIQPVNQSINQSTRSLHKTAGAAHTTVLGWIALIPTLCTYLRTTYHTARVARHLLPNPLRHPLPPFPTLSFPLVVVFLLFCYRTIGLIVPSKLLAQTSHTRRPHPFVSLRSGLFSLHAAILLRAQTVFPPATAGFAARPSQDGRFSRLFRRTRVRRRKSLLHVWSSFVSRGHRRWRRRHGRRKHRSGRGGGAFRRAERPAQNVSAKTYAASFHSGQRPLKRARPPCVDRNDAAYWVSTLQACVILLIGTGIRAGREFLRGRCARRSKQQVLRHGSIARQQCPSPCCARRGGKGRRSGAWRPWRLDFRNFS